MANDAPIPMHEQGNVKSKKADGSWFKERASSAWVNWDTASPGRMCILVKAIDGKYPENSSGDAWFKNYGIDTSANPGIEAGGVAFIWEGSKIIGWEACYTSAASCLSQIEIHANYYKAGTSGETGTTSTGKTAGSGRIALDLQVPCPDLGGQQDQATLDANCWGLVGSHPCLKVSTCDTAVGSCKFAEVDAQGGECCDPNAGAADCEFLGSSFTCSAIDDANYPVRAANRRRLSDRCQRARGISQRACGRGCGRAPSYTVLQPRRVYPPRWRGR